MRRRLGLTSELEREIDVERRARARSASTSSAAGGGGPLARDERAREERAARGARESVGGWSTTRWLWGTSRWRSRLPLLGAAEEEHIAEGSVLAAVENAQLLASDAETRSVGAAST